MTYGKTFSFNSYFSSLDLILHNLAGGLGIEPRYAASKAAVLPLDDPPIYFQTT